MFITLCTDSAPAADPYRFLDHSAWPTDRLVINGMLKRVLGPFRSQEVFDIPASYTPGVLSFAIGQAPTETGGTVRFEIQREERSEWAVLYRKDLSEPMWVEERITVPRSETPVRLRLGRKLIEGPVKRAEKSAWGDPVLMPTIGDSATRDSASAGAGTQKPSVLLISLDTLRADRVGIYGNSNAKTPTLDALARSGVWFSQASSPSGWTLPSHLSMLFGLHAWAEPCPEPGRVQPTSRPCPDRYQPLAEIFRQSGYVTAGFTGGGWLSDDFGFARGMDTYYMFPQPSLKLGQCGPERLDGQQVFPRAMQWLRERGHVPFFLFVHTYDPHDRCHFRTSETAVDQWRISQAERQRFLEYYDALISQTDEKVGALLKTLEEIGAAESTLVIVTSDHGEGLDEHGFQGHGCPLKPYEELTHIPLITRWPQRLAGGRRIDDPVSLVDLAPSVLALTKVETRAPMDGANLPGVDLPTGPTRPVYVLCNDIASVRRGADKLITSRTNAFPDELYDLSTDRAETVNRAGTADETARTLRRDAATYWASVPAAPVHAREAIPEMDPETKERLRALGYQ